MIVMMKRPTVLQHTKKNLEIDEDCIRKEDKNWQKFEYYLICNAQFQRFIYLMMSGTIPMKQYTDLKFEENDDF